MFYGILEASQGKTSIDLGRLVYSEAPWLLTYSLFGGMVGMNILGFVPLASEEVDRG